MKTPVHVFSVIIWLGLLFSGCTTAKKEVRRPTLLLVDHLNTYIADLDAQLRAEEEYYAGLRKVLRDGARRELFLQRESKRLGFIAEMADMVLVEGHGVPVSKLAKFLAEQDDAFDAALEAQSLREAEARSTEKVSFEKLEWHRKGVENVQAELSEILREPRLKDRVKELIELAQGVRQKLEDLDEKEKTGSPKDG